MSDKTVVAPRSDETLGVGVLLAKASPPPRHCTLSFPRPTQKARVCAPSPLFLFFFFQENKEDGLLGQSSYTHTRSSFCEPPSAAGHPFRSHFGRSPALISPFSLSSARTHVEKQRLRSCFLAVAVSASDPHFFLFCGPTDSVLKGEKSAAANCKPLPSASPSIQRKKEKEKQEKRASRKKKKTWPRPIPDFSPPLT